MRRTALPSQLLARKSIDKLIRESEEPEHRLKKTLGPWSLTALGIGAVIGSGIFTVIGTAISGEKFDTPAIGDTPLLHYSDPPHGAGRAGRARDLRSRCRWCWWPLFARFTGLCYAELASMIPIAGSAYTYTYATMGELIAWIIGWDLILEYAVQQHERERGLCRPHRRPAGLVRHAPVAAMDLARLSARPACRIWPATICTSPAGISVSTFPRFWW